jgi:hypothetical protein
LSHVSWRAEDGLSSLSLASPGGATLCEKRLVIKEDNRLIA